MSDSTERNCNKCIHHTSGNCDSWDCKMQTVEDVKKEAVNEYVKVVVEELKKESFTTTDTVCGGIFKAIRTISAIEIVKQGCVSDDVCEWKRRTDDNFLHTSCNNRAGAYSDEFKYCPYCGKKMKAVE